VIRIYIRTGRLVNSTIYMLMVNASLEVVDERRIRILWDSREV